jgi:hypothetical protein
MPAPCRTPRVAGAVVAAVAGLLVAGCGESSPTPVTLEGYLSALESICATTNAEFDALPAPPEQISVENFATRAAETLDQEAARAGRVAVPRDDAVRADHRAFVRNTEQQADAWRAIAEAAAAGTDVGPSADLVRQLVLGRNDLALSMGAPRCTRAG